jgi:hypothetical protein
MRNMSSYYQISTDPVIQSQTAFKQYDFQAVSKHGKPFLKDERPTPVPP